MNILNYDTLDSTQNEAKRLLEAGELTEQTLIIAREQTAGRGTQGRHWESRKDAGLYMTVVHLPTADAPLPAVPDYTILAAQACAETLSALYDLPIQIKPINDLYLHGRKLGGILLESYSQGNNLTAILTGVGINFKPLVLPEIVGYEAIGFEEVLTFEQLQRVSRQQLAESLAHAIQQQFASLPCDTPNPLLIR